jgi:regulator of protease activity HflC (stomatin/prohibitin superfamily)
MFIWTKVRPHERGLLFRDRVFRRVLGPGRHLVFGLPWKLRIDRVSVREPWLVHPDLEVIVRAGALGDEARVLDLADHQRALVWIDGRFDLVVGPGLYALWTVFHRVEVEVVDARQVVFAHPELPVVASALDSARLLVRQAVPSGHTALVFRDGRHLASVGPGLHAFWSGEGEVRVEIVDLREQVADVTGQEIMTADKVSLRLNAVVTFRVADALAAVTEVGDFRQALYREAQLALRAVVGTRELDALLSDKDAVARELEGLVRDRGAAFGVTVTGVGIRDVILPGDMREILNRVTEARKAAEAALVTRREETAAMRSQANTARIVADNPTLMRLRELEVLERVSERANLTVVLGEGGLAERVVKLL